MDVFGGAGYERVRLLRAQAVSFQHQVVALAAHSIAFGLHFGAESAGTIALAISGKCCSHGLDREYESKNAAALDLSFRWVMGRGLNLRLGVLGLKAPGESLKINPTPGISYSFFWPWKGSQKG